MTDEPATDGPATAEPTFRLPKGRSVLPLRSRLFLLLSALLAITLCGGAFMVWYTYRMQSLLESLVRKDLTAYQAAVGLQTALVNQKGFVTYYFLDGNPDWLRQLGEYRQIFRDQLKQVRELEDDPEGRQALGNIEKQYTEYISGKDQVIELYKTGRRDEGAQLHQKIRQYFFDVLSLCDGYKEMHTRRIQAVERSSRRQGEDLRLIAVLAMISGLGLAGGLTAILVAQILGPLDRLFRAASRDESASKLAPNPVAALSAKVRGLLEDVDQTHVALARSRESLQQAEKLAMVGKLAAGMAHSIRNPFTSVKMRLFSLNRSLELNPEQKEDFDVISEEIRHIDTIVQNFLEFSRPPKLRMQSISPSAVVDMALQLLEHRLKSYDVTVAVERSRLLPEIMADPEQLKEVLVNLIINACEAMHGGGRIVVREKTAWDIHANPLAVIELSDNGPGIPAHLLEKVFQPFFTTKEEGTGLGLSIVERIIREHRGDIHVQSKEASGATFTITLPVKGEKR